MLLDKEIKFFVFLPSKEKNIVERRIPKIIGLTRELTVFLITSIKLFILFF